MVLHVRSVGRPRQGLLNQVLFLRDAMEGRKSRTVVAVGETGFVSVESSSPKKTGGTFIPLVETPRRSPRHAAKRKRERSRDVTAVKKPCRGIGTKQSSLSTPTRNVIRRAVRGPNLLNELQQVIVDQYRDKKVDASIVMAEANNELHRYLIASRRTKAYDEDMGPHDSLKLVVEEDGKYKLSSRLKEGIAKLPFASSDMSRAIDRLCDEKWIFLSWNKAILNVQEQYRIRLEESGDE